VVDPSHSQCCPGHFSRDGDNALAISMLQDLDLKALVNFNVQNCISFSLQDFQPGCTSQGPMGQVRIIVQTIRSQNSLLIYTYLGQIKQGCKKSMLPFILC
jgi:hypothetical protein